MCSSRRWGRWNQDRAFQKLCELAPIVNGALVYWRTVFRVPSSSCCFSRAGSDPAHKRELLRSEMRVLAPG